MLIVEGSIPNEKNKQEGYWAAMGTDRPPASRFRPALDRPAGAESVGGGRGRHLFGLRRHPRHGGNPTGCMGLADYLGWDWKSKAGIPIVCVPGCPVQPDNFMETLLYLLYQAAGRAPMIPLDEDAAAHLAVRPDRARRLRPGRLLRTGRLRGGVRSPKCIVKLGCWGPVVQCNVGKRGWMGGIGGCPNVGGVCIGCTMPGFPDKFMPFMNEPPRPALHGRRDYVRPNRRALRAFTKASMNKEPEGRVPLSLFASTAVKAEHDPMTRASLVPDRTSGHNDPSGG